jgi:hypothetical protein
MPVRIKLPSLGAALSLIRQLLNVNTLTLVLAPSIPGIVARSWSGCDGSAAPPLRSLGRPIQIGFETGIQTGGLP